MECDRTARTEADIGRARRANGSRELGLYVSNGIVAIHGTGQAERPFGEHEAARKLLSHDETLACLMEMWRWQTGVKELLPEGLSDRIRAILTAAGIDPTPD
jgi:hypothetical protein